MEIYTKIVSTHVFDCGFELIGTAKFILEYGLIHFRYSLAD